MGWIILLLLVALIRSKLSQETTFIYILKTVNFRSKGVIPRDAPHPENPEIYLHILVGDITVMPLLIDIKNNSSHPTLPYLSCILPLFVTVISSCWETSGFRLSWDTLTGGTGKAFIQNGLKSRPQSEYLNFSFCSERWSSKISILSRKERKQGDTLSLRCSAGLFYKVM